MKSSVDSLQQNKRLNKKSPKKKKEKQPKEQIDFTLFALVIFLVIIGMIMIFSSSSYVGQTKYGDSAYFLKRQLQWVLLGISLMVIVSYIDYQKLKKYSLLLYVVTIFFLALVLVIGQEINGAKRWLQLGPIGFQPSEIAKLAIVVMMAHVVSASAKSLHKYSSFIKVLLFIVPPVALIAIENLSTAIVIICISFAILFVASPKIWHFFTLVIPGVVFLGVALLTAGYRMSRITAWLDPWSDPLGKGFQTIQSLYAIGSGGLFGKGLGQSMQKLGFIPEAHNDIIFAIICEELGLIGAISIILIFLFIIWRCMIIATSASDLFGSLLVIGVMAHIATQVIINIAVVTNTIPNTGMPLPFISYGGSSLLFLLIEMGIVMNVSRQIHNSKA